ncbi:MAG: hypothetical protein H0W64_09750 [Gammaproteobacteria bacterium]|nr:hypothetical protein [Gammaproteobacteria bacterium]
MNKENIKETWKVMMRKIKQQWDGFSQDELFQMQGKFEDQYRRVYRQQHHDKVQHSRLIKI